MSSRHPNPNGRWPHQCGAADDGGQFSMDYETPCGTPTAAKDDQMRQPEYPGLSGIRTRVSRPGHRHRTSETPGPVYPWPQAKPEAGAFSDLIQAICKPLARVRARVQGFTLLDWLQLFLPCIRWLRTYKVKEYLLWDVIAGVSIAFMVVPQGMSYANIAGVPSVYGLYGAFMPVLVYALFGSSRELAVGPVAVTSLLISSSLKVLVPGADEIINPNNPAPDMVPVQLEYNRRAIQLSLLVACMYTAVGLFNLGFLTNFLSHSVIGGFTSGAAIIIGLSQVKYILGYSVPRADKVPEQIAHYLEGIDGFVWQEYIMGVSMLTLLLTMKFFGKRYAKFKWLRPLGPISACVIAMVAVVAGRLQDKGIRIVGTIPKGLPRPTVSWWLPLDNFRELAPLALVVMLVDLLESTSIARALAAKGKYELNANQEIVGLGLANFAGSAFNAYSTTGSFSRSAVNYDSGCKTGLAGFVTACVVGLVLLVLTPVFEKLPLNVMGAIVISGVSGLFEYEQALHLFKVRKLDWLVWMTSCISTMVLGVETGLAISIGLALLIVIYESAFPHTALLGRVGNTTIYRNVKQFPNSQVLPGICACRVDAPMYFANVQYIHDRLRKYVSRARCYSEAAGIPLQYLLLDMSPVTHMDSTGAALLEKIHDEMAHQGIQLGLCNPAAAVIDLLDRTDFPDNLGREWIFVRMHDAIVRSLATMVSLGYPIKPASAIHSSAVSPRRLQELMNSPLGRHSTRGTPLDTDATLLCAFDPATGEEAAAAAANGGTSSIRGVDGFVTIDPALAAALVPSLSTSFAGAGVGGISSPGPVRSDSMGTNLSAAASVRFLFSETLATDSVTSTPHPAPGANLQGAAAVPSSSTAGVPVPVDHRSPFAVVYRALSGNVSAGGSPISPLRAESQQMARLSRLSGAGGGTARSSAGGTGARAAGATGPYAEALLGSADSTPTATTTAAAAAAVAAASGAHMQIGSQESDWALPR